MKEYKQYEDVPKEYRYDLNYLLDNKSIEQWFKDLEEKLNWLNIVKDSKFENANTFVDALDKEKDVTICINKISNYISNNLSVNVISEKFNVLSEKFSYMMFNFEKEYGSEINRIFQNEEKIKSWLDQGLLKNYAKDLEYTLEEKKHKFSDEIENFLNKISRANICAQEVFEIITNSELDYGYATNNKKKKIKITPANHEMLMNSLDEEIRKSTYLNWANAYLRHKNSLSNLLFQHIKHISTFALARKYNSSIASLISADHINESFLQTLYKQVKDHNYLFANFFKIKKYYFKIKYQKEYKPWDSYLKLIKINDDCTIEQSKEMVLNALKPMGKEYINQIKKAFNENWIDYCVVKNKRSGAYSIGSTYGIEKKYIFMNHNGKLSSSFTLAHEMGHSIHSYYSDNNQPYNLSQYPIFLAEIASIFNELMLMHYLINNTNDDKMKLFLLGESISEFQSTVKNQIMWSEFEYKLYNKVDEGESFGTFDSLKKIYLETINLYKNDPNANLDKDIYLYPCFMVPHFYYDFYVYKYAIGYMVANYFFQDYLQRGQEAIENYINNFLKKGASKWPLELLKDAGIDLNDPTFYDNSFKVLEEKINLFKTIAKNVFKK